MTTTTGSHRVLFIAHAAERTGPPIILLDLLRWLHRNTDIEVGVVFQNDGPLRPDFDALGPTWVVQDWLGPGPVRVAWSVLWKLGMGGRAERLVHRHLSRPLRDVGHWPVAYVNTAGCSRVLPLLPSPPEVVIAHVHELLTGLDFHLEPRFREMLFGRADRVITVSHAVTDTLVEEGLARPDDIATIHGWIEPDPGPSPAPPTRADLGIPDGAFVVGSSGLRHWRKGTDLFVSLAARLLREGDRDLWFVWVGGHDDDVAGRAALADVERAGIADRVRFVEHQARPRDWFELFDVFALTAREDAFPLVCLEAGAAGLPVVCFTAGGMPEFVRDDAGAVVPYPDVAAMADAITSLRADPAELARRGAVARARVRADHDVETAAPKVADEIRRAAGW